MKSLKRIVLVLMFTLVLLASAGFIRLNKDTASLWLLMEFSPRPVGEWVLLAFIAGGTCGILAGLGILRYFRNRMKQHSLESQIVKLKEENEQLRAKELRNLSE